MVVRATKFADIIPVGYSGLDSKDGDDRDNSYLDLAPRLIPNPLRLPLLWLTTVGFAFP